MQFVSVSINSGSVPDISALFHSFGNHFRLTGTCSQTSVFLNKSKKLDGILERENGYELIGAVLCTLAFIQVHCNWYVLSGAIPDVMELLVSH